MSDQIKFNSSLEVTQTSTLGSLNVSGTTTFNNQVAIVATNDTVSIVATGVSVTGSTTITGAVCIYGDTKVQGTVTITGNTSISGTVTITGGLKADTLQLQSPSTKVTEILTRAVALNFPNVAGDAVATVNVTIGGSLLSSFNSVLVDTPDILDSAFIVSASVVADDTVGVKVHNTSNGTKTAITATYNFVIFQFT